MKVKDIKTANGRHFFLSSGKEISLDRAKEMIPLWCISCTDKGIVFHCPEELCHIIYQNILKKVNPEHKMLWLPVEDIAGTMNATEIDILESVLYDCYKLNLVSREMGEWLIQ